MGGGAYVGRVGVPTPVDGRDSTTHTRVNNGIRANIGAVEAVRAHVRLGRDCPAFFNNCFDGALTCAGIVSGSLVVFLGGGVGSRESILITGFATALAIGISGVWGAFLSEEAERKKKMDDLRREMVILDVDEEEEFSTPFNPYGPPHPPALGEDLKNMTQKNKQPKND